MLAPQNNKASSPQLFHIKGKPNTEVVETVNTAFKIPECSAARRRSCANTGLQPM